jgi:hypothetical protein
VNPPPNGAARRPLVTGHVLLLDREASVQFVTPIMVRLVRVLPRETYEGYVWLDVYELNAAGDAVARRELFVQIAGIKPGRDPLAAPNGVRPAQPRRRNAPQAPPTRRGPAAPIPPASSAAGRKG